MDAFKGKWLEDYKIDKRPFIQGKGWGPGNYTCNCCKCGANYLGEKRSIECADCAYETPPI